MAAATALAGSFRHRPGGRRTRLWGERSVGSLGGLPDVEQAKAFAQGIAPLTPIPDSHRDARRKNLIATQRTEREAFLKAQEARRIETLKARPKGLRRAFLRVTGRHKSFITECEVEAKRAQETAARKRQAMIDRHLTERRPAA